MKCDTEMVKANGRRDGDDRRAHAAPFGLIDLDSGNMVGSFASEREALLAVAATAQEFGATSNAVLSLSLFRDDVPSEDGHVADGEELVRRALAAAGAAGEPLSHVPSRA